MLSLMSALQFRSVEFSKGRSVSLCVCVCVCLPACLHAWLAGWLAVCRSVVAKLHTNIKRQTERIIIEIESAVCIH